MGSRSRKRRRGAARAASAAAAARRAAAAPARRARRREPRTPPTPTPPTRRATATPAAAPATRRSAQSLEPLAPGERPRVVTIAAIVAFVFAIANVVATLTGDDLVLRPAATRRSLAIVTTALLVVAGVGMLARQYWAVLGFQAILGLQIVVFSLCAHRRAEVVAGDRPARRDRPARLAVLEAHPRDGAAADARASRAPPRSDAASLQRRWPECLLRLHRHRLRSRRLRRRDPRRAARA